MVHGAGGAAGLGEARVVAGWTVNIGGLILDELDPAVVRIPKAAGGAFADGYAIGSRCHPRSLHCSNFP